MVVPITPKKENTGVPQQGKSKEQLKTKEEMQSTSTTPQVDGFKVTGKLKGDFQDITNTLRAISFLEVAPEAEVVNAIYIESRDINKNPYLFSIIKIKSDEVEVLYSIPPEIAPRKRRIDVIRYLLNLLTLIDQYYNVENKALYQLLEVAVKELLESVTMDYSKLYTTYDALKKKADDYANKVARLKAENQALTTKNYELKSQNDELAVRNKELEAFSDETLRAKLQEWITEHNGEINVIEFCKIHNLTETRAEQMLNKLVAEGYLSLVE